MTGGGRHPGEGGRPPAPGDRRDRRDRRGGRMQVPVAADRFDRYTRDPRRVLQTPLLPQAAGASPLAPGGSSGAWSTVNRSAWWRASPRTTSRWSTWPARWRRRWRPATRSSSSPPPRIRWRSSSSSAPSRRWASRRASSTSSTRRAPSRRPARGALDVDMVSFTGSTAVGVRSPRRPGKTMKRLLMGYGGQGRVRRLRRRGSQGGDHVHRVDMGVPLRPDLHRADPGDRPPQHLRPGP